MHSHSVTDFHYEPMQNHTSLNVLHILFIPFEEIFPLECIARSVLKIVIRPFISPLPVRFVIGDMFLKRERRSWLLLPALGWCLSMW